MNFGKWIIISFVLFASFIATLVFICVRQDINLVSNDYYREELVHGKKMEYIQNAKTLQSLPDFTVNGNMLTVSFSDFNKVEKGELRLLRPSDAKLDRKFLIAPKGKAIQTYALEVWHEGLYRASMQWRMDGKEYYYEKLIVL
ncbi:MAG TPA: FixH family protein [Cyclobacteriaceae bacterium]